MLEKAGVPAIPVITDAFGATAAEMAQLWGVPGFQAVAMPHPLASLGAEQIEQHADALTVGILQLLCSGQPG